MEPARALVSDTMVGEVMVVSMDRVMGDVVEEEDGELGPEEGVLTDIKVAPNKGIQYLARFISNITTI